MCMCAAGFHRLGYVETWQLARLRLARYVPSRLCGQGLGTDYAGWLGLLGSEGRWIQQQGRGMAALRETP